MSKLQEINPVYAEGTIPAATYNLKSDVKTIVVPNLLLVTDEFPANNACAITKLLWSSTDKLAQVHPSAKDLDPKLAQESAPVELAAGSKEALTELAGG